MKQKIYCPDIECESCIKILDKRFSKKEGIESHKVKKDHIEVEFDDSKINEDKIIGMINDAGFRASLEPFDKKTLKERMGDVSENTNKYTNEISSLKYALFVFLILLGLETIAYFGILRGIPNFLGRYGIWIFYADLTIASIGGALWHYFSYKLKVSCMLGMMTGMTIGMQTGMMLGAIIGATNGFFMGALVGMIVATVAGIIAGRACGVMGVLQGMMAGVMGGTMGPMVSVMMLSDHIRIFMPFYIIINMAITWGMVYMVYEEAVEDKEVVKKKTDFWFFASLCVISAAAIILLMIYGYKAPIVAF